MEQKEKDYFSVEEIADKLDVTVEVVRGLIRRKELVAYRIGKEYRINRVDFEAYLKKARNG